MTVDERLQQAWADVEEMTVTAPDPHALLRRRTRAGRVVRAAVAAAVVLVVAGVGIAKVPDRQDELATNIESGDPGRDAEARLLDTAALGDGWALQEGEPDPTTAPCGAAVLEALEGVPMVQRTHLQPDAVPEIRFLVQQLYVFDEPAGASAGFRRMEAAVAGCASYENTNPDGGTTAGTLEPFWREGDTVAAYAGGFGATADKGEAADGFAQLVLIRSGGDLSLLFDIGLGSQGTSRAEVEAIVDAARSRLRPPAGSDGTEGDPSAVSSPFGNVGVNRFLALLPFFVLLTFLVSLFVVPVWGLVDVSRRPEVAYQRTGHNRTLWLAGIGGGMFFGLLPGVAIAVAYLLGVRPKLAAASAAAAPEELEQQLATERDPAKVRRRRMSLLIASGLVGILAFGSSPVPDNGPGSCRPPAMLWRGAAETGCEDPERTQLLLAMTILAVTAGAALLVRRVPAEQRFRGVFVQLAIGGLLVAGAAGSITGNPEWLGFLLRAAALAAGIWLIVRAARLIPARRSISG